MRFSPPVALAALLAIGESTNAAPQTARAPAVKRLNVAAAQATATIDISGNVLVPSMSALAPVAHMTATYNANGDLQKAQVVLNAAGRGPGLCAENGTSTLWDTYGRQYKLACGFDAWGNYGTGADIYNEIQASLGACVRRCAFVNKCDTVVFSKAWSRCWFKHLGSVQRGVQLTQSNDRLLAYLPEELKRPLVWPEAINPVNDPTPDRASTITVPAVGTITLPGEGAGGLFTSATATVSAGTTLDVEFNIMFMPAWVRKLKQKNR